MKKLTGTTVNKDKAAEAVILQAKQPSPNLHNNNGLIILCVIPGKNEFVTWWMNDQQQTFNGHYYQDLDRAIRDFKRRI